jgi:hypothetical protein
MFTAFIVHNHICFVKSGRIFSPMLGNVISSMPSVPYLHQFDINSHLISGGLCNQTAMSDDFLRDIFVNLKL